MDDSRDPGPRSRTGRLHGEEEGERNSFKHVLAEINYTTLERGLSVIIQWIEIKRFI